MLVKLNLGILLDLENLDSDQKIKLIRKNRLGQVHRPLAGNFTKFSEQLFFRAQGRTQNPALREKCPYSELFWCAFSRIWTGITPNMDTFYVVQSNIYAGAFAKIVQGSQPLTIYAKQLNR